MKKITLTKKVFFITFAVSGMWVIIAGMLMIRCQTQPWTDELYPHASCFFLIWERYPIIAFPSLVGDVFSTFFTGKFPLGYDHWYLSILSTVIFFTMLTSGIAKMYSIRTQRRAGKTSFKKYRVFVIGFFLILIAGIIIALWTFIFNKNTREIQPERTLEVYTDNVLGYVLEYPSDWQIADGDYQFTRQELSSNVLSHRMFFFPYQEPAAWPEVQIGVAVYTVPETLSMQEIMRHDEDIIIGEGKSASYTGNQPENITSLKVGNYDALRYEFNDPIEGGPQIELLVRKGERVYDIEASAGDSEKFAQWKATLEDIIAQFRVL